MSPLDIFPHTWNAPSTLVDRYVHECTHASSLHVHLQAHSRKRLTTSTVKRRNSRLRACVHKDGAFAWSNAARGSSRLPRIRTPPQRQQYSSRRTDNVTVMTAHLYSNIIMLYFSNAPHAQIKIKLLGDRRTHLAGPSPCMSNAPLDTKCFRRSTACAGHLSPAGQRVTALSWRSGATDEKRKNQPINYRRRFRLPTEPGERCVVSRIAFHGILSIILTAGAAFQ